MNTYAYSLPPSSHHSFASRRAKHGTNRFLRGSVVLLLLLVPGGSAFAQTPLTPSTLSFGNQVVNQPSAAMSATLKNTQAVPLSISSIALSGGSAASDYVLGGDCPLSPSTLGPGENCRITVTFTPSAPGVRTATLAVTDDAHTSAETVALTGTGVAAVDLAARSGNFAGVASGNGSAPPSVTPPNPQNGADTSSGATRSADSARGRPLSPANGFGNINRLAAIVVTPANSSIVAGSTQQFTATGLFAGGETANLTTSVLWVSSAPGVATINAAGLASAVSPGSTTITATYVTVTPFGPTAEVKSDTPIPIPLPAPEVSGSTTLAITGATVSLSTSSLTFNLQDPGTTSAAQAITLTNTGTSTLTITGITLTGNNPGDFALTTTGTSCAYGGGTVAASGTCTINVTFDPTASGTRSASVSIADNASGSPQTAGLSGMGAQPLSITTPPLPGGTVGMIYSATSSASGGTTPYTWSLAGGSFPGCLSLGAGSGPIIGVPVNTCVGTFNFTEKVTDADGLSQTEPLSIQISPAGSTVCESGNEPVLSGQYMFRLIGYKTDGTFSAAVGSFTADGAGNIDSGEADSNKAGGSAKTATITGTYTVGADNRGCATFTTSSGSTQTRFVLGAFSSGTATAGGIIEFDSSKNTIAAGQIFQQTTTTSPNTSNFPTLNGTYLHLLTGFDSTAGSPIACAGVDSIASGNISNFQEDCNDGGTVTTTGPISSTVGTYSSIDEYGRFTETTGTSPNQNILAAYTNAAGSEVLAITTQIDGANTIVEGGEAIEQSSSLPSVLSGDTPNAAVSGDVVFYATGISGSSGSATQIGLLDADGVSSLSGNLYGYKAGSYSTQSVDCGYSVASNGRMTLSSCGSQSPLFYLYGLNDAFMLFTDNSVSAGQAVAQTVPEGGFTNTSVAGTYYTADQEIVSPNGTADDNLFILSASGSTISGTYIVDSSSSGYQQADSVNTFSGVSIASNGLITEGSSQVEGLAIDSSDFVVFDNTGNAYTEIFPVGPSLPDTVAVTLNSSSSSSANVAANSTLGLTLAVTGSGVSGNSAANAGVTWTLNGIPSTSTYSEYGTISGSGTSYTYTPPQRVTTPSTFTITATSNADVSQWASVSVTVTAPPSAAPLSITTTSLPSGTVGSSYSQIIQTSGGTLPLHWSVTSGSTPPGIRTPGVGGPNGLETVTGTPTTANTYNFTLTATDSTSPTAQTTSQSFSLVINPAS